MCVAVGCVRRVEIDYARAMRLADVGEFGLIDRIARLAGPGRSRDVVIGIGDDAALLRPRRGEDVAVTSDAFVEGVHFRFDQETPRTAGRRALAATLSDLAAMGARPLGFTLALAAPPALELRTALALARGLVDEAGRHGCPLVGGNVTRARHVALTLTALGGVRPGRALRRDRARPGDRVWVTGALGISALERLRKRVRHVPSPRLGAGLALGRSRVVGACIDVSDGLIADLGHICRASGVGAEIELGALPLRRGFAAACRRLGRSAEDLAARGGEDYELIFTLRPRGPGAATLERRLGVAARPIGHIRAGHGVRLVGAPSGALAAPGWRHF